MLGVVDGGGGWSDCPGVSQRPGYDGLDHGAIGRLEVVIVVVGVGVSGGLGVPGRVFIVLACS